MPYCRYVTLKPFIIPLIDAPLGWFKRGAKHPELYGQLIARMAVDTKWKDKGLGKFLLRYALKCCWDISQVSAFHLVAVDAKDERLKAFYIKHGGFTALQENSLRLYIRVEAIPTLISN